MSLKITIVDGNKTHHFVLNGEAVCQTMKEVRQFCYQRFPYLLGDYVLKMYWNDVVGDKISIMRETDYRSFLAETGNTHRRLYVEAADADAPENAMAIYGGMASRPFRIISRQRNGLCLAITSDGSEALLIKFPVGYNCNAIGYID